MHAFRINDVKLSQQTRLKLYIVVVNGITVQVWQYIHDTETKCFQIVTSICIASSSRSLWFILLYLQTQELIVQILSLIQELIV